MSDDAREKNPLACFDLGFMLRVFGAAIGMVLLALLGRLLGLETGSPPRIAVALAQVALMGYVIALSVGTIRRLDELMYRIQLEAIAFAFAASGILMTGWGFMAKAGLPAIEWGPWAWPVMVLFWAAGLRLARRRYR